MISDYVIEPVARERLRRRAAGIHVDAFADWLADSRYSAATIYSYIYAADRFMEWWSCAEPRPALTSSSHTGLAKYRAFLASRCATGIRAHDRSNSYCGARRFLIFLQQNGSLPGSDRDHPQGTELESRFRLWLLHHRGVKPITADGYGCVVSRLLVCVGIVPATYTAAQLRAFVLAQSQGFSRSKAETTVSAVRMYFRFLIASGECQNNLQYAIPRVAGWRQASLPRYLPQASIEQIIANCDPSTALGARDRAILLLLARLGLRASDVAGLRLRDLDWTNGRIRVSGKSQRSTWLPLPQDAGDAVLHYLAIAHHATDGEGVFLTTRAPYAPIITRQVSSTAERAIRRAGIKAPSLGAHLFRHSAATEWLRQGLSLQAVGAVLRHQDPDTTAIYAKVDIDLLRQIAMPWPVEGSSC